jgi:nucleotide-binding universal stress UspA family protein
MYKRILICVDDSDTAVRGAEHGIRLAAEQQALVRVLNVIDDSILVPAVYAYPAGETAADAIDSLRISGKKAVNAVVKRAAKRGVAAESVQVESRLRRVSDVIVEHARNWRADLIVMGTHGRRGMDRVLLGSDAERVLREAPVPVLLVRQPSSEPAATGKHKQIGLRRPSKVAHAPA